MTANPIHIRRLPVRLSPDPRRTITRFFWPGEERARKIITRIQGLAPERISSNLKEVLTQFAPVTPGLEEVLLENFKLAAEWTGGVRTADRELRLLIGAYFSMEYAFEAAALFNPSMVPAIDQSNLPDGSLAFVMSLRAVGEGHLSSIVFRRGIIDATGEIQVYPASLQVRSFTRERKRIYYKEVARKRIDAVPLKIPLLDTIFAELPDQFTFATLDHTLEHLGPQIQDQLTFNQVAGLIRMMAQTEYVIPVDRSFAIEDMVLFPFSSAESRGMEDMRAVRFEEDDGTKRLFGTYTAYNGREIIPLVMEIPTFQDTAMVHMMLGKCAKNKGMAFFPKRIDGQYAIIGRIDGENMFLLKSNSISYWDNAKLIGEPKYDWEFVQIGNCGSPLLTDEGWLLLTHGVGPMRRYCMGAMLLDLHDPSKVIARLDTPLMSPIEEERSGYVPNVVYSCGALIHHDMLVIPYGISDMASGFAIVHLPELMSHLK